MAQVTMDSKEYLELVDNARMWDQFNAQIIEETKVNISEDNYNGYRIDLPFSIPAITRMDIARKVVEAIVQSDEVMEKLVEEKNTVLDLRSGYISRNWGHEKPEEVDLMKFPEFKAKYEAIKEEPQEEE